MLIPALYQVLQEPCNKAGPLCIAKSIIGIELRTFQFWVRYAISLCHFPLYTLHSLPLSSFLFNLIFNLIPERRTNWYALFWIFVLRGNLFNDYTDVVTKLLSFHVSRTDWNLEKISFYVIFYAVFFCFCFFGGSLFWYYFVSF